MDVTYELFRRLLVHWQQSIDAGDAGVVVLSDPEQHARRLIAQCGRSWDSDDLAFEEDADMVVQS